MREAHSADDRPERPRTLLIWQPSLEVPRAMLSHNCHGQTLLVSEDIMVPLKSE